MGIGLRAQAEPAARGALGLPASAANSLYDTVCMTRVYYDAHVQQASYNTVHPMAPQLSQQTRRAKAAHA